MDGDPRSQFSNAEKQAATKKRRDAQLRCTRCDFPLAKGDLRAMCGLCRNERRNERRDG
jgi:Zn finger protein HypA/HybF involved in hydrogenase expression